MSFEPQVWADPAGEALAFYVRAFEAKVLHLVGEGDDIVARLGVEDGAFWVAPSSPAMGRRMPLELGSATGRVLLVTADPARRVAAAIEAGAELTSAVDEQYGWRMGQILDPYGHAWEIGHPLTPS